MQTVAVRDTNANLQAGLQGILTIGVQGETLHATFAPGRLGIRRFEGNATGEQCLQ